jgi:hypothetical protein
MWIMLLMGSGWFVRDRAGQLGENGESVMDHKFGAPMVVVPPVSIKDRVGCAPCNELLSCVLAHTSTNTSEN